MIAPQGECLLPSSGMAQRQRTTDNNLTAFYKFLDEKREPTGILWSRNVIEMAQKLQSQVNKYNNLEVLKSTLGKQIGEHEQPKGEGDSGVAEIQERIRDLEQSLREFDPRCTYDVPDIYGKLQTLDNLKFPNVTPVELSVVFRGIVALSKLFKDEGEIIPSSADRNLCYLYVREQSRHNKHRECEHVDHHPPWKFWKQTWETGAWHDDHGKVWKSSSWNDLAALEPARQEEIQTWAAIWKTLSDRLEIMIRKHSDQLKNVDKVICFALGALMHSRACSYVQHLAARTIADTLNELNKERNVEERTVAGEICILAQDPAYCSSCTAILKDELDIRAVTDLEGFLTVDQNTFVLCFAPAGPITGIIADLTRESGGPAAMLCDRIDDDFMRPEHEARDWIDATETKNLVEWKKTCSGEAFGDAQDFLGKSLEEHKIEFPTVPACLPTSTDEEMQVREAVKTEYRKRAQVNFRDAWLYVRRD
jgi:hypothetical protein